MPQDKPTQYTAVQHSAVAGKNDMRFARGLEPCNIKLVKPSAILKAGGRLFDNYGDCDKFCHSEMYPPSAKGMIPQAPGSFSNLTVDGLRVYVPVKQGAQA